MFNINRYLYVQYDEGGRTYPRLDCWGLIVDYYKNFLGITLSDFTDFSHSNMQEPANQLIVQGWFTQQKTPKNNDVIAYYKKGVLFHVGIYYNGLMLHASNSKNGCLEKITNMLEVRYYRYENRISK